MTRRLPFAALAIAWAVLSLPASGATPVAPEEAAPAVAEPAKEEAAEALREGFEIGPAVAAVQRWKPEDVKRYGVLDLLYALVEDKAGSKRNREAALDALRGLAMGQPADKPACPHKDLAAKLLEWIEAVKAPTLAGRMIDLLLALDQVRHDPTEAKIQGLVSGLIADAAKKADERKYPSSVHAAAFRAVNAERANPRIVEALVAALKKPEALDPELQLAALRAVANLAMRPEAARKHLPKAVKGDLAKAVLDLVEANPAGVPAEVDRTSEPERVLLKATLLPAGQLLGDEEVPEAVRLRGLERLKPLVGHPNTEIMRASATALMRIERQAGERKLPADLGQAFLESARARAAKAAAKEATAAEREAAYVAHELLARYLAGVVHQASQQERAAAILACLREVFWKSTDMRLKEIAAGGFYALDPALFEQNRLSSAVMKEAAAFFDNCLAIFELQDDNPLLDKVKKQCAAVLYEMTGNGFGADAKRWRQWREGRGQKFFR